MSALNLTILISVLVLIIAEFFIIRYRRSIKKFRGSIQAGDRVQVRIGSTLLTVIVPTSNTYPL